MYALVPDQIKKMGTRGKDILPLSRSPTDTENGVCNVNAAAATDGLN
jgi:hypothetical protein